MGEGGAPYGGGIAGLINLSGFRCTLRPWAPMAGAGGDELPARNAETLG